MNTAFNVSDTEIARYLLGTLEGPKAELIDELTVTSETFADRVSAIERDLVDEYLRGELEDHVVKAFEHNYLQSPIGRERTRIATIFKRHFERDAGSLSLSTSEVDSRKSQSGLFWKLVVPAFGVAIILAVVLPFLYSPERAVVQLENSVSNESGDPREPDRPVTELDPAENGATAPTPAVTASLADRTPLPARPKDPPRSVVALVLTPQTRGATNEKRLRLSSSERAVNVRLHLEPTDYSVFRVELRDMSSGSLVWQRQRRSSSYGGSNRVLRFEVPPRSFGPGSYSFTVYGIQGSQEPEIVGDYPFKVVR